MDTGRRINDCCKSAFCTVHPIVSLLRSINIFTTLILLCYCSLPGHWISNIGQQRWRWLNPPNVTRRHTSSNNPRKFGISIHFEWKGSKVYRGQRYWSHTPKEQLRWRVQAMVSILLQSTNSVSAWYCFGYQTLWEKMRICVAERRLSAWTIGYWWSEEHTIIKVEESDKQIRLIES